MNDQSPKVWTYEVARPHGRVWLQSTDRFSSAEEASLALGFYLALTPEDSGSFIGRVVLANDEEISLSIVTHSYLQ